MSEGAYERGYKIGKNNEKMSPIQECLVIAGSQGGDNNFASGYRQGVMDRFKQGLDNVTSR